MARTSIEVSCVYCVAVTGEKEMPIHACWPALPYPALLCPDPPAARVAALVVIHDRHVGTLAMQSHNNRVFPAAFRYLTPKLRLDHTSLPQHFILSRTFHLICSPARCSALVTSLLRRRATVATSLDADADQPLFIWEPVPDMCMPSELPACIEALKHVDVVSPNHAELCAFLGAQPQDAKGNVSVNQVEAGCKAWLDAGVGRDGRGAVVVRAGKDGCLVATRGTSSSDYSMRWVPAFHQRSEVDEGIGKIVDPTGGGNAFLGGLAVGLARLVGQRGHLDLVVEAALWGSVAASFAIEQIGMPTLERREHGEETWNGDSADLRVQLLKDRISSQP